jgi:hypothetical protein
MFFATSKRALLFDAGAFDICLAICSKAVRSALQFPKVSSQVGKHVFPVCRWAMKPSVQLEHQCDVSALHEQLEHKKRNDKSKFLHLAMGHKVPHIAHRVDDRTRRILVFPSGETKPLMQVCVLCCQRHTNAR